jgi:hypothetical protein
MPRPCKPVAVLATALSLVVGGCGKTTPEPLPEVARESGVTLDADPDWLVIRPSGSGRLRFQAHDEAERPLAYYPVDFSIESEPGQGTVGARLSTQHSLTNLAGETAVEVMVGPLANQDRPVAFWVLATCPGAPPMRASILVTTNAYSVEILPLPADDLLGSGQLVTTVLYFYDNAACAAVDLFDIDSSATQARAPQPVPASSSFVFQGVAASGVHAVVGLGLDSTQTVLAGGCVDVPGTALLEAETMRATLVLDHLFPALSGTFAVSSDFQLNPLPKALDRIRAAWQQWQRCPYDPARLWLDCTLAALGPAPDACVPIVGNTGSFSDLVSASRGAPLPETLTSTTDAPCRGATDSGGNPSLEVAVDALFTGARGQLSAAALGSLPSELTVLLGDVRLTSRLSIAKATDANTYWAEHRLLAMTFPNALSGPVVLGIDEPAQANEQNRTLAVPIPAASGILATFAAGQFFLPNHGFTLRLGTATRYAFEIASLGARNGAKSTDAFVESIFSLAQLADPRNALAGCAAFDAVVCDRVEEARGCIVDACRAGLVALGRKLVGSFDDLDGSGLDFHLWGSAPVVDLDADGRADALGTTGIAGGVAVGPGLWSAIIDARAGPHVAYGSWLAARDPASR